MKSTNSFARIAFTLLCLFAFASASFAATRPLQYPYGLAVDAKGNLYVANNLGNDILVYSTKYTQVASRTITQGVNNPTGIAFDPFGNLWVANEGSGNISEYTAGKQNTSATITNSIYNPNAIAFDGLGNLWVENNIGYVTVYAPPSAFYPPSVLVQTLTPSYPVFGIAVAKGTFAWGGGGVLNVATATPALISGALNGFDLPNDNPFALAADATGNIYVGNVDGSVNLEEPSQQLPFVQLSFMPNGIAVDSTHGRVYFSNANGNSISVYSTAGALLHVIQ
jgi:DNA-binding beta-propeller fold protein YncE